MVGTGVRVEARQLFPQEPIRITLVEL